MGIKRYAEAIEFWLLLALMIGPTLYFLFR